MPRKCKNGDVCQNNKGYATVEEKTLSLLQPLFVVGIMLMFYIFYFRILKRRLHMNNDNYNRKISEKKNSSKPIISLCLNDIVIKITDNNGDIYLIENSLEPFYKLCIISELFVIAQITSDVQEKSIVELFKSLDIFKKGLKEHRVMFCNTATGRASMIRQLSPLTHVDSDENVIKTLTGKIPNLVKIYGNNTQPMDTSNFTSLQAFTQVISAVANVEEIGRT